MCSTEEAREEERELIRCLHMFLNSTGRTYDEDHLLASGHNSRRDQLNQCTIASSAIYEHECIVYPK